MKREPSVPNSIGQDCSKVNKVSCNIKEDHYVNYWTVTTGDHHTCISLLLSKDIACLVVCLFIVAMLLSLLLKWIAVTM